MAKTVTYRPELVENKTILSVEHLKQYFGSGSWVTKAVDDVTFQIQEGECFGIVGESGCGKTTTGRSIIGLYDISGGSVFYKGTRVSAGTWDLEQQLKVAKKNKNTEKVNELKAEIAARNYDNAHKDTKLTTEIQMIFQDPVDSLDPRMTVETIIEEGLKIQGMRNPVENHAKVAEILEKVGLIPEYASRYPHEFSGGQRQRIGIARALVMNPKLLICDEPISALDVSIRAQILNLLNGVKEEMGLTMIFIAHDLSVVKYFCDRIAVMYFGHLVELASSDELFAHPLHPYTRALLSAIPKPDPISEKNRIRKVYNPSTAHDYKLEGPSLREVAPGHFVLCNSAEEKSYQAEIAAIDSEKGEANE